MGISDGDEDDITVGVDEGVEDKIDVGVDEGDGVTKGSNNVTFFEPSGTHPIVLP